jgi:hypothetical protein
LLSVCLSNSSLRINFWMPGPVIMKLCMYIMAPESIWTAHFINPYHQSVCLYTYTPIVARQRLSKYIPAATNARNNRRNFGRVVFYMIRVMSKKSRRLMLPIIYC